MIFLLLIDSFFDCSILQNETACLNTQKTVFGGKIIHFELYKLTWLWEPGSKCFKFDSINQILF